MSIMSCWNRCPFAGKVVPSFGNTVFINVWYEMFGCTLLGLYSMKVSKESLYYFFYSLDITLFYKIPQWFLTLCLQSVSAVFCFFLEVQFINLFTDTFPTFPLIIYLQTLTMSTKHIVSPHASFCHICLTMNKICTQ